MPRRPAAAASRSGREVSGASPRVLYLDHHATTPVDPRVMDVMAPLFTERFGNAASHTHAIGWRAEAVVEVAREQIAAALGAEDPRTIVFTSGATESNNLALLGAVRASRQERPHVVTVASEHPAVLDPCRALEAAGARLTVLPVDGNGLIDPTAVAEAIQDDTVVVSVMAANNEIGVLQPLKEIGEVCAERGVLLHSDAAQAVGKIPLDVDENGIDLLSVSGHKLYAPQGIGVLYVRRRKAGKRIRLEPLQYGGGHEWGLRPGTLPMPLIGGLARAIELAANEREEEGARLSKLRELLLAGLRAEIPDLLVNGHPTRRLPGNLNVTLPGARAEALLSALHDVAISSGSACSSARPEPSHVLRALGHPDERIACSVRIGLGRFTTEGEIGRAVARITEEAQKLREGGFRQADPSGGVR
ncbi:MAG: cysteine desulfurase [Deltaproteobacteria bacterium]|nr:cysteine desulfurase [Deltaproteobacteria bacterium]MBW2395446.1 cysteine desulfurase [Deltaproteobacteria bacterium]